MFCRKCGYALRGLTRQVCPECGQAFDLSDPATFTTADAGQLRRRRWLRRGAIALAVGLILYAVAPRGIRTWNVSIYCDICGKSVSMRRHQLTAPSWITIRYPGVNSGLNESNVGAAAGPGDAFPFPPTAWKASAQPETCRHHWAQIVVRGHASGRTACSCSPSHAVAVNGLLVTPDSLPTVLYDVQVPLKLKQGIGMKTHCLPDRSPASAPVSGAAP